MTFSLLDPIRKNRVAGAVGRAVKTEVVSSVWASSGEVVFVVELEKGCGIASPAGFWILVGALAMVSLPNPSACRFLNLRF